MSQSLKLIVLDRDGVINQDSDAYIKHPDEWHPEAGSIEAIVKLKQAGWIVAIATNQSGLKRGYYNHETLSQMHQKLQSLLIEAGGMKAKVDWISFSPYLAHDGSQCRKPGTGMLEMIAQRFDVSLINCPMVGDTLHDVEAAKAMQMRPHFVLTGKGQGILDKAGENTPLLLEGVPIYNNLLTAVEAILQ